MVEEGDARTKACCIEAGQEDAECPQFQNFMYSKTHMFTISLILANWGTG